MLMGVQFRVKKNAKDFNAICMQNTRDVKDRVISQHINLPEDRNNFCFTSIKLHMISGTQVMCRANISLHRKAVVNRGDTMNNFCTILRTKERKHQCLILLLESLMYILNNNSPTTGPRETPDSEMNEKSQQQQKRGDITRSTSSVITKPVNVANIQGIVNKLT
jgi:hypothetical protein